MEGQDTTNKGAENEKDSEKAQEVREQETNDPNDRPSNKKEHGSYVTSMDGEIRDDNTPMKEAEGYVEMNPSEVGTKDPNLIDLMEREGIDLPNILE